MSELEGLIIEVMKKLTVRDRMVLSLRHIEKMTFSQIASILEANFVAAWLYYLKARRKLKRQLLTMGYGKSSFDCAITLFDRLFDSANQSPMPLVITEREEKDEKIKFL
jgi:hypothetical protein